MPMLAGLIEKADVTWQEIDRLAVTHGPGSFTGVRVGLSAMRGLALALQKPLKTYGSFDVMARAETAGAPLLVAVDARRDTFYVQAFNAARVPSGPPQAVSAAAALEIMTPRPLTVIGSGAEALCGLDPGVHKGGAPDWPQAEHLAAMAAADEDWAAPPPAEPLYLRPPDASLPDPTKKIALADDAKASEGP